MVEVLKKKSVLSSVLMAFVVAGCGGEGGDGGGSGDGGEGATMESPVDPSTAGNISGSVTFEGTPPAMATIDMSDEADCAATYDSPPMEQTVIVNDNGTLANVFVYVMEGLEDMTFPTPEDKVVVDQNGCRYAPHVVGVQTNQTLAFKNSDGLLHNVKATPTANRGFNISQPMNMESDREFSMAEVMIPIECSVHGWMKAYLGVVDHPYFAVSNMTGAFSINTLPPGDYLLGAWHERYGTLTADVTVATGETAEVTFAFGEAMAENAVVPLGEPIDPHDHASLPAGSLPTAALPAARGEGGAKGN